MGRPQTITLSDTTTARVASRASGPVARGADVVVALVGLVLTAPLFVVIALAVRSSSHGPVLHREQRRRKDGSVVEVRAFRTLVDGGGTEAHEAIRSVIGGSAETPVGRVLRRTRLAKLPSLTNVLAGDVSLFGSR